METSVMLDPTGAYKGFKNKEIMKACGLYPRCIIPENEKAMREILKENNPLGERVFKDGKVGEDLIFRQPNDADMPPLIKICRNSETFLQYADGFIAILSKDGGQFITEFG